MWKIEWDEETHEVASIAELDELLDQLSERFSSEDPRLVGVQRSETRDCLTIGIGRDISVLNFMNGTFDPPYVSSVSTDSNANGLLVFRYGGDWTEIPAKHCVPIDVAREAMRHFCRTGALSESVLWAEV